VRIEEEEERTFTHPEGISIFTTAGMWSWLQLNVFTCAVGGLVPLTGNALHLSSLDAGTGRAFETEDISWHWNESGVSVSLT
jgi:hypothetical protein